MAGAAIAAIKTKAIRASRIYNLKLLPGRYSQLQGFELQTEMALEVTMRQLR